MPNSPIHPGEILKDEIDSINLSAAALAKNIRVPANRVTQIISGKRNISADTALRLGKFFGTVPRFWLNLQTAYALDKIAGTCSDWDRIVPLARTALCEIPGVHAL